MTEEGTDAAPGRMRSQLLPSRTLPALFIFIALLRREIPLASSLSSDTNTRTACKEFAYTWQSFVFTWGIQFNLLLVAILLCYKETRGEGSVLG